MLKGRKFFHFSPFPDKTIGYISLKSPKDSIFGHFYRKSFFQKKKNQALSRTSSYEPLTPYKVSEKTNQPIPRKLPERRIGGRTEDTEIQ